MILCFAFAELLIFGAALPAHALGLGELKVLSGLGQPLKANVILIGSDVGDVSHSCIRAKVATTEGTFLAQAAVVVTQTAQNKVISMSTGLGLNEPAIKITIDISCETQLHRDFLVLLDPPEFLSAVQKNSPFSAAKEDVVVKRIADNSQTAISAIDTAIVTSRNIKTDKRVVRRNNDQNSIERVSTKTPKKIKSINREKSSKDVLRLSEDSSIESHGLKMSDTLSSAPIEQQISANMEELRAAQRQMAAILQGENPALLASSEQALAQKKMQKLLDETAQLRNQNRIAKANLDEIRRNSYSRNWIISLASLLLFGFLMILAMAVYVRRVQKKTALSWWDQGQEKKETDRRKSIEEMVDYVQASYEPSAARDDDVLSDMYRPPSLVTSEDADITSDEISAVDTNKLFDQSAAKARTPTLEETNSSTFNFFSSRGSSVKVEEISDITQEAEFWMSVNDPQRAIEILDAQANVAHPDSPVPWLYLLDLYRLVKDRPKYDDLRDRFVTFFNAKVPEYENELQLQGVLQLEDYPHLIERICRTWNGNEIIPFLESLLVDDREGKRTGFELPVYRDILLLISIAHELERVASIEGPVVYGQKELNDGAAQNHNHNQNLTESSSGSDLSMIEFEVIDFPKISNPKE